MKKLLTIIIILVVIFVIAAVSKNIIAKGAITGLVKSISGLSLDMESVEVGIPTTKINIEGLKLYNPPEYADKVMIDMPQIYVDYGLGAFLKGKIYLHDLTLYLKEFVVIKNKEGKLNLDSLKVVKSEKEAAAPEEKKKEAPSKMQIDVLNLKIDRVIYKDYSRGKEPIIKEYEVYLNERYANISDPEKLAKLILYKALVKTAVARLVDFNLGAFQQDLDTVLKSATGALEKSTIKALEVGEKAGEKIGQTGKKALEKGGEATKGAVETIKKTFQDIKFPIRGGDKSPLKEELPAPPPMPPSEAPGPGASGGN
jgi:hypothetical protein